MPAATEHASDAESPAPEIGPRPMVTLGAYAGLGMLVDYPQSSSRSLVSRGSRMTAGDEHELAVAIEPFLDKEDFLTIKVKTQQRYDEILPDDNLKSIVRILELFHLHGDTELLHDLFCIRIPFETNVAQDIHHAISDPIEAEKALKCVADLDRIASRMEEIEEGGENDCVLLDLDFHKTIAMFRVDVVIGEFIEQLRADESVRQVMRLKSVAAFAEDHRLLVQVISDPDSTDEEIAAAMHTHISNGSGSWTSIPDRDVLAKDGVDTSRMEAEGMDLIGSLNQEYLQRLVSLGQDQEGDAEFVLNLIDSLYQLHGGDLKASMCDVVFEKFLLHRRYGREKTILFDWEVAHEDRFGTRRSAAMKHVVEDWIDVMSIQGERMASDGRKYQQLLPAVECAFVL